MTEQKRAELHKERFERLSKYRERMKEKINDNQS